MSYDSEKNIRNGYAAIHLVLDEQGRHRVPVGVVGWDARKQWYGLRVLRENEKVSKIEDSGRQLLKVTTKQFRKWADAQETPYYKQHVPPWTSAFWQSTAKALTAAVRLGTPKAVDPEHTLDRRLDGIFEAIVQPEVDDETRTERIDGKVSRALGDDLTSQLTWRRSLPAYHGGAATVMRSLERGNTTLIVDGVNLAGANARDDADALVSRIQRIRAGRPDRDVVSLIAYMASPNGLNGEGDMKAWIEHKAANRTFDVEGEREEFQETTREILRQLSRFTEEAGETVEQGDLEFA